MKAFIAVVLVALFAVAASQYDEEADFPIFLAATLASQLLRRKRDSELADQNNSFGLGANVNNGQWNVNGQYNRNFNGGSLGINGNVGSGGQWGVGGQYQRSWNNGNTNLGINGGYNNGAGWNAGLQFTHRFDDVEESDAQFFKDWMKKAGSWLKNPENLQKVVDVYRTVRSDEEEEADQNNNFNFGANVNNGQWGVNGQYTRQWNNGNTNLGVQGGWQQGSGYNAGVTFSHRWDDAEDEDESDFSVPSWVNWENAQRAIDLYQQLRRDEEDEDESDYIYGFKCINLGSSIGYSGSYDQCRMSCNQTAKSAFVGGVASRVTYFPRAMFSSGGCSCCGNTM